MFSIYGENGRIFQGSMEDLRRVDALRSVVRTRRVPSRGDPPVESAIDAPHRRPAQPQSRLAGEALSAYAEASGGKPERHPLSLVRDVMSWDVVTVPVDMNVLDAWKLLIERGVGQAPVIGERGELAGLLTRAELLDLTKLPQPDVPALTWRAELMQTVASVMFSPVPAVSEEADLRHVARVLLDTHLPGLPVMREAAGGHWLLSGFISRSDILKAVVHDPPLDLWS